MHQLHEHCHTQVMAKREIVVLWTEETGPDSWSKQVFEDLGGADLVRTSLGWYVGSGPEAADMVLDNEVTSQPDGSGAMRDTHTFKGGHGPTESERGQPAVYLRDQLAGEARSQGTLYLYRSAR